MFSCTPALIKYYRDQGMPFIQRSERVLLYDKKLVQQWYLYRKMKKIKGIKTATWKDGEWII